MDYKSKYLKYKNKYLYFKNNNLLGGDIKNISGKWTKVNKIGNNKYDAIFEENIENDINKKKIYDGIFELKYRINKDDLKKYDTVIAKYKDNKTGKKFDYKWDLQEEKNDNGIFTYKGDYTEEKIKKKKYNLSNID